MRLNWLAYNYREWDGYGRYSNRMVKALLRAGVDVSPLFAGAADMPAWMLAHTDTCLDGLTISCLPPYYLRSLPKRGPGIVSTRHWLLTMTEGSECPDGWAEIINKSDVERVIVPCQHNAEAFRRGGVEAPITVIPGGTCPNEFPLRTQEREPRPEAVPGTARPYTFLALADRGARKGWFEAYEAFFLAFGSVDDTPDVRLILKSRPDSNGLLAMISKAQNRDPRLCVQMDDVPAESMASVYAQADCFVIPSRSEGWGMPHRECAMMGVPVITQRYSGMDDGYTDEWATVVEGGRMEPIPSEAKHIKGEWRVCDRDELAAAMYISYRMPEAMDEFGQRAATWLRNHQTWDHSVGRLVDLIGTDARAS